MEVARTGAGGVGCEEGLRLMMLRGANAVERVGRLCSEDDRIVYDEPGRLSMSSGGAASKLMSDWLYGGSK